MNTSIVLDITRVDTPQGPGVIIDALSSDRHLHVALDKHAQFGGAQWFPAADCTVLPEGR